MAEEYRSFFNIGLYDLAVDDSWPWHCHYEDGVYLSSKKRCCKRGKAAEFDTPEQAREFFHNWSGNRKWKMELIEYKRWTEIPAPVYPADHPVSILEAIRNVERYPVCETARLWFAGEIKSHYVTKVTLKRHREKLLVYGIDIDKKPKQRYKPSPPKVDKTWHLSALKLTEVKTEQ